MDGEGRRVIRRGSTYYNPAKFLQRRVKRGIFNQPHKFEFQPPRVVYISARKFFTPVPCRKTSFSRGRQWRHSFSSSMASPKRLMAIRAAWFLMSLSTAFSLQFTMQSDQNTVWRNTLSMYIAFYRSSTRSATIMFARNSLLNLALSTGPVLKQLAWHGVAG